MYRSINYLQENVYYVNVFLHWQMVLWLRMSKYSQKSQCHVKNHADIGKLGNIILDTPTNKFIVGIMLLLGVYTTIITANL